MTDFYYLTREKWWSKLLRRFCWGMPERPLEGFYNASDGQPILIPDKWIGVYETPLSGEHVQKK